MTLEYWYMLPIAILVATTAMASGVGGATFFAPIFILVLRLPPEVAIGVGLITEVFGFASGLFAYVRKRLIDYQLGGRLLLVTVPVASLGARLATGISPNTFKTILGVGLFAVALSFLREPDHSQVKLLDKAIQTDHGPGKGQTRLVTAAGEEIWYTVCNKRGLGILFVIVAVLTLAEVLL